MSLTKMPEGVSVREDILYASHDGTDLLGDLYLPAGDGPFPVLVGVPGGGWRSCRRTTFAPWGAHLAAHGYGLFVTDYRLATDSVKAFPEALQDVAAAIQFIGASGKSLSVDPSRIGLIGPSAGAHLSALAALADHKATLGGWTPGESFAAAQASLKAVVLICGIYDLYTYWQQDIVRHPEAKTISRNLIGHDPYECQRGFFDASPLRHVSYDNCQLPILLSWSEGDEMVDREQAEGFLRALQEARFNVTTHKLHDASHFWFAESPDTPNSHSAAFAPQFLHFLESVL